VAAGYDAGIVFNNMAGCEALVSMLAARDVPFVFVARSTSLQLLNQPQDADVCTQPTPATADGQETTIEAVFDGWG